MTTDQRVPFAVKLAQALTGNALSGVSDRWLKEQDMPYGSVILSGTHNRQEPSHIHQPCLLGPKIGRMQRARDDKL